MTDADRIPPNKPHPGGYEVGYGKPPVEHRFQKGRSGNPSGRPKHQPSFAEQIRKALNTKIVVAERGKRRRIAKSEAAFTQLVNQAASGDKRALTILLKAMTALQITSPGDDETRTSGVPPLRRALKWSTTPSYSRGLTCSTKFS